MATRCPASGLLVACLVWALDAPTPRIRRLGRMHEVLAAVNSTFGICSLLRRLAQNLSNLN